MAAGQHAHQAPPGTGIPESQSWPALAQRQKRWAPKARTGCLTCRRRRIKCDETKPVCNRCTTSANYCERYDATHNIIAAAQASLSSPKSPLCNANDRTCSKLLYFLNVTDPGYGLNSWRPNLLKQLPQRMGYSKVLDTTVATFTSLLETLHGPSAFQQPSHRSRQLYISSLKGLQRALATPDERYRLSTIFSASLLAQCHVWMHQNSTIACGHGQGLTHLLRVLLVQKPKDPFALGLCYAMLAEVVEEAVFNPKIQLFPWIQTLYSLPGPPLWKPSTYTATKPELTAVNLAPISMIPGLMRNPRENKQQVQSTYDYLIEVCLLVNKCVMANEECPYFDTWDFMRLNEIHGMCAGGAVVLNAFLRTFHPSNIALLGQKFVLCAQVIALAERAMHERPLCAHHVPQALLAAWCVTDGHVKARLRQLLQDYRETYAMARLVYFVASWPEAPAQIQDIPWFTMYDGRGDSHKGSGKDGPVGGASQRLTEYCCIL